MMTIKQVSQLAGVSVRTLQYYDSIGLLPPAAVTESGYRLYDGKALEKLQLILLFRELEFPLKEIYQIINNPEFDREKALSQQMELLALKKERLEKLISFAGRIKTIGVENMDFSAFDTKKIDEYTERAKAEWGHTEAYHEFAEKNSTVSREEQMVTGSEFMTIFAEIGKLTHLSPADESVQALIGKLQDFITKHYYTCTREILAGLGQMYGAGGEFTENIDKAGGNGCAVFTAKAIEHYCGRK